jgi:hypothetical protein
MQGDGPTPRTLLRSYVDYASDSEPNGTTSLTPPNTMFRRTAPRSKLPANVIEHPLTTPMNDPMRCISISFAKTPSLEKIKYLPRASRGVITPILHILCSDGSTSVFHLFAQGMHQCVYKMPSRILLCEVVKVESWTQSRWNEIMEQYETMTTTVLKNYMPFTFKTNYPSRNCFQHRLHHHCCSRMCTNYLTSPHQD